MKDDYIYEELTLAELSERFLLNNDFKTPSIFDMDDMGIEVLTTDKNKNDVYCPIKSYVIKSPSDSHYTDGKIKVTGNHRFIEDGNEIFATDHKDFHQIKSPLDVVDIEVKGEHSFLANGRLNHNTTSGGKALGFHSSVRLRLSAVGKIKADVNGVDTVVGMKTKVVVTKNRMGPPHKVINFDIYFDSGIDNYGGWLGVLKAYKIVSQGGAYYTYQPAVGDEVRFMQKDFVQLITDRPEIKQELYDKICENYIMKYDQAVHGTDSIKIVGMNDESDEIETANQLDGGVVTDENDG